MAASSSTITTFNCDVAVDIYIPFAKQIDRTCSGGDGKLNLLRTANSMPKSGTPFNG
jgi:hypothetical protein